MEKQQLDLVAATLTAAMLAPINYAKGRVGDAENLAVAHAVEIFVKVRSALEEKFPG
jgi:hypothetical protein